MEQLPQQMLLKLMMEHVPSVIINLNLIHNKINSLTKSKVLMSEKKLKELNIKPLARIVSYADAEV